MMPDRTHDAATGSIKADPNDELIDLNVGTKLLMFPTSIIAIDRI